jgi:hypothetical protein
MGAHPQRQSIASKVLPRAAKLPFLEPAGGAAVDAGVARIAAEASAFFSVRDRRPEAGVVRVEEPPRRVGQLRMEGAILRIRF